MNTNLKEFSHFIRVFRLKFKKKILKTKIFLKKWKKHEKVKLVFMTLKMINTNIMEEISNAGVGVLRYSKAKRTFEVLRDWQIEFLSKIFSDPQELSLTTKILELQKNLFGKIKNIKFLLLAKRICASFNEKINDWSRIFELDLRWEKGRWPTIFLIWFANNFC